MKSQVANAAQWMAEFEVIWNQMQAEQRQREDKNHLKENTGMEICGRCYYVSADTRG